MNSIQIDQLADELTKQLTEYGNDVTVKVKKASDTVAKEVMAEIKSHITFNQITGKYIKAFRTKTSFEDKFNKRNTWYVAGGEYRLTHLLENGHLLRNGKRTKAYPHIIYGDELARRRMEELAKEAIQGDSK